MNISTAPVVAFPESQVSIIDAYLRGLPSARTRVEYSRAVRLLNVFMGDSDLMSASRRDIEAWRAAMEAAKLSPCTITKRMSAVSGMFDYAIDEGIINANPCARARRPKVPTTSPRRGLSIAECRAMLDACDCTTTIGLRDRALVTLLAMQGLRLSEALGLTFEDLDEEAGHKVATIRGKGAKVARVPLAAVTWEHLRAWVRHAEIEGGAIMVPVLKGGRIQRGRAMSSQSADKRMKVLAKRAGINRVVHAHLFRHAAVSIALQNGVPLHHVQDFARHADPKTTRRYDAHRHSLNNPTAHLLASKMFSS